jgi:hypothetical protein
MAPDRSSVRPRLVVTGDSTIDWLVIIPDSSDRAGQPVQLRARPGGAARLSDGIRAALSARGSGSVIGPSLPQESLVNPSDTQTTRTYSIWQPYSLEGGSNRRVWRMHRNLGISQGSHHAAVDEHQAETPDLLVIEDVNTGFRSQPDSWPPCLHQGQPEPQHILLKISNPIGEGLLWDQLIERFADILTVYCTCDDLRQEYASIGQPLSWERSASEVVRAIRSRANLTQPRRMIVSLGCSGAVIVDRDGPATLIFDPQHQEGDWERKRPGIPVGAPSCLTSAIAIAISDNPADPDWNTGIMNGLNAARAIHQGRGVEYDIEDDPVVSMTEITAILSATSPEHIYRSVTISDDPDWNISSIVSTDDVRAIAPQIVIHGDHDACQDIPTERIGAWTSIDRAEIESMRSARGIAREYLHLSQPSRPLSMAVFGPPGSGKSFAIKQMTREPTAIPRKIRVLEFNLSQFKSPDDLPLAFQSIRDCTVEQALPLVFWDEFDATLNGAELGWVSRFLAPMQDGIFSDNGISRPIGPAIFIFAGGTHSTMESFKSRAIQLPEAKATDFLSRLRGYLDILGPNPTSEQDRNFVLRRALLLRGLLIQKASGIRHHNRIDIDPGVLRAFLDISTYVHGARSMESIIDMSTLTGRRRYERSSLPPMNQLGLHVNAEEFLSLVHQGA